MAAVAAGGKAGAGEGGADPAHELTNNTTIKHNNKTLILILQ